MKHTMNMAYTERVKNRWKWVIGRTAFVASKMMSYTEKLLKMKKACGEIQVEDFNKLTSEEKRKAEKNEELRKNDKYWKLKMNSTDITLKSELSETLNAWGKEFKLPNKKQVVEHLSEQ